jgi:RNA polymerase sigma factor (sigma-70 family)
MAKPKVVRTLFRSLPSGSFDQYLRDIQKLPMITDPAEERRLARLALSGDERAAERLVTANLRFVISYVKRYQGHGLDLSELVAIGNEGLLKAVRKFDPDHGVKFISYAVWWVRQAVLKALAEQTRSVRIPLNQNSHLIKMSRCESYLSQELGREPTDREIATALGDTVENVRAARRMTAGELSLDAPVERHDRPPAPSASGCRVPREARSRSTPTPGSPASSSTGSSPGTSLPGNARSSTSTTGSRKAPRRSRWSGSARCSASPGSGSGRSASAPSRSSASRPTCRG